MAVPDLYQYLRPLLFRWNSDPEGLHQQLLASLGWVADRHRTPPVRWLMARLAAEYGWVDDRLSQSLWGLTFPNPIGLAAGFDKNAGAAPLWPSFGFGFAELGTITCHAQPGNPRPRLFRLPDDRAVLNRMGFNNDGAAAVAARLAQLFPEDDLQGQLETADRGKSPTSGRSPWSSPIGINLGKSKITPLETAELDYVQSFRLLQPWGDYFVVNVSSPNTPGLRSLQSVTQLAPILAALQQENTDRQPLLVKIAPDLSGEDITAIADLARQYDLAGIIATNTTIQRQGLHTQRIAATGNRIDDEPGGISGAPLQARSTEVIRLLWQHTHGSIPIIGVGGIFTAEDAWAKITAGASLLQLYTGWVYEGPWVVRRILTGLLQYLDRHQLTHLSQAIGLLGDQPIDR